jgi:hypothetical protein
MVSSSKKKRGQQRKAAKNQANSSSRDATTRQTTTDLVLDEAKCIRDIARGCDVHTRALLLKDTTNSNYV